jgi:23S rRNA (pseudouridine1915-N3)-methyltransferase
MKITILAVGKMRSAPAAEMVKDYIKRAGRFAKIEMAEVKAGHSDRPAETMRIEGERLLAAVREDDTAVVCDERGEMMSSRDLADQIRSVTAAGGSGRLVFIVGGAEGLAEDVRCRAALVLSLSKMTIAHELARVVLAEQVYRALTIIGNHPYHRGS